MKILLIDPVTSSCNRAVKWLEEERHHAVVRASDWPENWPVTLAQFEPDLVLLPDGPHLQHLDYLLATSSFPECEFRAFDGQADDLVGYLKPILEEAEQSYRKRPASSRPFADNQRYVIHDDGYMRYAAHDKLHVPQKVDGWEEIATSHEAKFILQLQTGMSEQRHQRAKQYFAVLRRFNQGIKRECAYRQGHGSYKIAWLRDQIARWMTVLAYYVADAEVENCPPPQNASSGFAFLHHEMPAVFIYPVCCVLLYGIRPALAEQIKAAVAWSFEGEDETQLAAKGYLLFGINEYLAEVARAQIWSMDQFLSLSSEFHLGTAETRSLRRTMGVFFEFWGWNYMWNMGRNLRQITVRFHSGETHAERSPGSVMVPSFHDFRLLTERDSTPSSES